ncbi:hypothetical protein VNO80_16206 [Phaseolus coccineus]|uniref:Uncharacterized protein n=1 Tax=Phaseolus coccineus TaxID=3886 RepID=A0AAN9MLU0_PHACN
MGMLGDCMQKEGTVRACFEEESAQQVDIGQKERKIVVSSFKEVDLLGTRPLKAQRSERGAFGVFMGLGPREVEGEQSGGCSKRSGQAIESSPEGAEAGEALAKGVGSGEEQRDAAGEEEDGSQVLEKMKDPLHHEHASGTKQPSQAEHSRRRKLVRRRPLVSLTGSPLFLSVEGHEYNLRSRSRKATTWRGNDGATVGDASRGASSAAKVDGDIGFVVVIDGGTNAKEEIYDGASLEVCKGEGDKGERDQKEKKVEGLLLRGIEAVIMGGGDQSKRDSERQSLLEFTPSVVAMENQRLPR